MKSRKTLELILSEKEVTALYFCIKDQTDTHRTELGLSKKELDFMHNLYNVLFEFVKSDEYKN